MNKKIIPFLLGLSVLLLVACGKRPAHGWLNEDDVRIAIDATFRPIMEEQLQQFSMLHPTAQLKPLYCSEDSALRLLVADSLSSCVATRKLKPSELDVVHSRRHTARQELIATDAFALIVSRNCPDTLITLDEVKGIVSGRITRWEQLAGSSRRGELKLLFDHSGSSTVRYMRDSLCSGAELQGNVFAQGSSEAVIDFVRDSSDVIGVVGVDWLRKGNSATLTDFGGLPVRVMLVQRDASSYYRRPYQYYIGTGEYPLTRSVYAITTDPRQRSQEKLLWHWLKEQKGQLIFCNNSQLLPMMPVQVKAVKVK
ncbi:MAG: substrate-binding domain-containing protein [Alloprevotella sp.]|nr:substrate-binding domain-containing protein [Alloprevotella sp.]